jgi:hypothetical protein
MPRFKFLLNFMQMQQRKYFRSLKLFALTNFFAFIDESGTCTISGGRTQHPTYGLGLQKYGKREGGINC